MIRRVAYVVLGLGLSLGALTACGDDGGDAGSDAGKPPPSSSPSSPAGEATPAAGATEPGSGSVDQSKTGSDQSKTAALKIPRTYDDAMDHFDAVGSEPVSWRKFVSPSGNIFCVLKMRYLRPGCEISQGTIKDPSACPDSPFEKYVGRIEFHKGRAVAICNTDTIRTPGAKTLKYGEAARFRNGRIQCLSESIGVTCVNLKKTEGFFLHRGEYVIFNAG